ncbi:MAG: response regulator [Acidimicrobiia bacterium]|nr:response regulator [Acidimicrobiia bacterium]
MARVLLVTDASWVRNQTMAALGGPDNEIIEVADPRAALDHADDSDPGIAIVDLQVGSMGGMAVTRSLKDGAMAGDIGTIPILLLLDRSADSFLAKRAGADAWLIKPFAAQDLRAAVDSLLVVSQS